MGISQPDLKLQTLTSIQYLRGAAALGVVVEHTHWTHSLIGAAGVDLFFVISGFIMVHVSRREPAPGVFLRARVIRVVPMYWAVTLCAAMFSTANAQQIFLSLTFLPQPFGPDGQAYPVLYQGWTLNYEMFFYVLFAGTLFLPARLRSLSLSLILCLLVTTGLVWRFEKVDFASYLNPILLEFMAGAWLAEAWQRGLLPGWYGSLALIFGGVLALLLQHSAGFPGPWRSLAWGVPSLMVIAGLLGIEVDGRLPTSAMMRGLGDASYSIYLTHPFVVRSVREPLINLPGLAALPVAIMACALVGYAIYRLIERPFYEWMRSYSPRAAPRDA